jgi:hypothetical protein
MIDPAAKVQALAEKARAKRQQLVSDEKTEKQRQWQSCKEKAPKIALFLTELNKTLGKPKAVAVKVDDEIILKNGAFDLAKDLSVPKYSQ